MPLPSESLMASAHYGVPPLPPYASAAPTEADFDHERDAEEPSLVHDIHEVHAGPSTAPIDNRPPPLNLRPPPAMYRTGVPLRDQGADEGERFNPLRQWGTRRAANATASSVGSQRGENATVVGREPGRTSSMRAASILVPEPTGDPDTRKMYYRVYSSKQGAGIMPSRYSINNDDPGLTYLKPHVHLAPPYTVRTIKEVICRREQVHPSRATLYLTARATTLPPAADTPVDVHAETERCPGEQGDPMLLKVEMSDPDEDASQPLPAGGAFGKWWGTSCIGRGTCFVFTFPCKVIGVRCDRCMEDCSRQYARHPEPTSNASII